MARVLPVVALFGLALIASLANAVPTPLAPRQSITALSSSAINAFAPYSNYAAAGYCSPASTLAWNCGTFCEANPGFQTVAAGGDGNAVQFWFVGYDSSLNTIIVVHQGTDPTELLSVLTDGDVFMETLGSTLFPGLSSSIEVHSGFANEHAQTAPLVLAAVQTALSKWPTVKTVTLVGHSLGAALSLLDSVYLPLHLPGLTYKSILYGLPRVGNQAFADYASIGNTVTHINNKEDVVPIVPGEFLGFHHPTGEVHIQDDNAWLSCPGEDNSSDLCSTGDVPTILNGSILNHLGPYNGNVFMGIC